MLGGETPHDRGRLLLGFEGAADTDFWGRRKLACKSARAVPEVYELVPVTAASRHRTSAPAAPCPAAPGCTLCPVTTKMHSMSSTGISSTRQAVACCSCGCSAVLAQAAMSSSGQVSSCHCDRICCFELHSPCHERMLNADRGHQRTVCTLSLRVSATAQSSDSCFGRGLPAAVVCQAG